MEVQQDGLFGKVAQLGLYFLLALFPAIMFLTALIKLLPTQSSLPEILSYLKTVLPVDSMPLIDTYLDQVVSGCGAGIVSLSFLGTFWAVSTEMAAMIDTLNAVYHVKDSRPLWKARGIVMIMTIGCTMLVILSMSLILAGGYMSQWIANTVGYGAVLTTSWSVVQWPLVIMFMV